MKDGKEFFSFAIGFQAIIWGVVTFGLGILIDKFGPQKILAFGIICFASGIFLMSNPNNQLTLFSATSLMGFGLGGAGISIINSSIFRKCNFVVWNRSKNKYKNIQRDFLEFKNNYDKKIDLVISCVSEMNKEISEIILNTTFQEFAHIYDINYRNETNTHYKNISLKKNVSFNSGEGMLVEQAALSWGRWFGDIPDTSDVKARIENGRL